MKIDAYSHILPRAYFDRLVEIAPDKRAIKRWLTIPVLHDLDARLAMMEEFGSGYRQILTLSMPALESVAGPDETPALSRLANNCMAELVARRPDRFPGFVASLGLNNVAAALHEMRRSIEELGAIGIQLFTNVGGRPLDEPEFWPIFEAIAQHDLPVCCIPPAGPVAPTIPAKRNRSTRSGGRSAGPTRRAWPCRGWSSRSSSCGCRGSR